jgi:pyruvate,water dikinase
VRGERELLDACRRCYASLFTDRAISYRETKGFDHLEVALSIGVQRMVRSDLSGSGVMFSIDTESGFPRAAVINAAWGLGETVVQGTVNPDKYAVFKPLLADARLRPIIDKTAQGTQDVGRQQQCARTDGSPQKDSVLRAGRHSAARPLDRC